MIHKFFLNSYFIIIDVYSGAIHIVDNIVYDILDYYPDKPITPLYEKYPAQALDEALAEIKQLESAGLLYSAPISYAVELCEPQVKALCLLIAQECNMRCGYCFAQEGEYNQGRRGLMSLEVAKASIDYLLAASGNRHNLEVDFFGGEPLLNFDVIRETVKYARTAEKEFDKNIRFTLTTNGLLLDDEKLDYINEHMQNLVLSLDGRQEVNDKMRKTTGGKGTYDILRERLIKAAESRKQNNYYVRGTFTAQNPDFAADVLHLAELGFKQISIEPMVGKTESLEITPEHIPKILAEYEALAIEMLAREKTGEGFNFFHFMMNLENAPCFAKRIAGCGAGHEYFAVTVEGKLYPCHQLTGVEDFALGDVFQGIQNPEISRRFAACNVFSNETCNACWAKFHCSGGCVANAWQESNNLEIPHEIGCILMKKRIECAVMIACAKS